MNVKTFSLTLRRILLLSAGVIAAGCTDTVNTYPAAVLKAPDTARVNVPVLFDASGSSDAETGIRQYRFDFGDGSNIVSGVARAEHTYALPGTFEVTLTVTDQDSMRGSVRVQVAVAPNGLPVATFDGPILAPRGQVLTFDGSQSHDDVQLVSYSWDFDDKTEKGANAVEKHVFEKDGAYIVKLTVTDNDGATSVVERALVIRTEADLAAEAPLALLSVPSRAHAGEVLTFDGSLSKTPGAVASYRIYFGDGAYGDGRSLNHAFAFAGNYTAALRVTATYPDGSTAQSVDVRQVSVDALNQANPKPVISLTMPTTVRFATQALFDASRTIAEGANSIGYTWDFGDGTFGAGDIVSHTYAAAAQYIVRLKVVTAYPDATTQAVYESRIISIQGNTRPVASLVGAASGLAMDTLAFDASGSSDSDGTIASYALDFGDGSPLSTVVTATHKYLAAGVYSVVLTITDNDGATSSATRTVIIDSYRDTVVRPVAMLSGPAILIAGQTATFSAAGSSAPGASNVTYKLYFGDAATALAQPAAHAYAGPGIFQAAVLLTATYPDGTTNTATAFLPVEVKTGASSNAAPLASFTAPAVARFSDVVHFDASASTAPGAASVVYAWNFGDASVAAGITPSHVFAPGAYTVQLTVTATYSDGSQSSSLANRLVTVNANAAPVALLTGDVTGLATQAVSFDASGSSDIDGIIVSTEIDFGDGNVTSSPAASHSYAAAGVYTVTVTVTDSDGDAASTTRDITIRSLSESVAMPVAVLNASALLMTGASGQFTAAGSTAPGATGVMYSLNMGDATILNGQSVGHAYSAGGSYTVTLTVTATYADGTSNVSTATAAVEVKNGAQFYAAPTVSINGPATSRFGRIVNFASVVNALGAQSVDILWAASNGATGTGPNFQPALAQGDGVVAVQVTADVTYADGSMNTISSTVDITVTDNTPPVAMLTGDTTGLVSQAVGFDASSSSDVDGTINAALTVINFGDTASVTGVQVATHTYAAAGDYTVSVTVTDSDGDTATASRIITIKPYNLSVAQPVAVLSGPMALVVNQAGSYTAAGSSAPGAVSTAYKLYFGTAATSLNQADTFAFTPAGDYLVRVLLTATYPDATTNTATAVVAVVVRAGNTLNAAPSATINAPANIRFSETANLDANGSTAPGASSVSYKWYFGDGNADTGSSVSHQYAAGTFQVSVLLTATYSDASTSTAVASRVITVAPNAAPLAVLTGATTGIASQAVSFDASGSSDSDGSSVTTLIDFGDGTPASGSPLASHVYAAAGEYTVTCTVTDADGDARMASMVVTINAYNTSVAAPVAVLNGPTQLVVAQNGVFSAVGSSAPGASSTSYKIYFGDNATSLSQPANHAFAAPGIYQAAVLLTATYPDSTTNVSVSYLPVEVKTGASSNAAPVASFSAPSVARFSDIVNVDASASTAPGATSVAYDWDFDFGNAPVAGSGILASTSYGAGTYTIRLVVTATYSDTSVATSVASRVVTVNANAAPVAVLLGDTTGLATQAVSFDASASSDIDGIIVSTEIDFGDGSNTSAPAASHTYAAAGVYTVTVTVWDNDGDSTSTTRDVTIRAVNETVTLPVAVLNAPTLLMAGANGQFTVAGSTAPGATSVMYDFDMNDFTLLSGQSVSHAYGFGGIYTVTLTLTANYADGTQNIVTATADVEVKDGAQFYAAPTVSINGPATSRFGRIVNFASVVNAPGAQSVDILWSASNGATGTGSNFQPALAQGDGVVTVQVTADVTYADGSMNTVSSTVDITVTDNAAPVAMLTGDTTGLVSQAVGFDASGSLDADGTINDALTVINFGDTASVTGVQVATHTYAAAGDYTVTVTVTDNDGDTATASRIITIKPYNQSVAQPVAVLSGPTSLVVNQSGPYTAAGSSAPGAVSTAYKLYFGATATSLNQADTHAFTPAGNYLVRVLLTATYPDATTNTATAVVAVVVRAGNTLNAAPSATINAPANIRFSETANLDANGSTAPGASSVSYKWYFGDGNTDTGSSASHQYLVGTFQVSVLLTATYSDASTATAVASRVITVAPNAAPVAVLTGATMGIASQAVSFDASGSSDSDGSLVSTVIDFGDGNSTNAAVSSHTYVSAGVYTVTATVTDNDGATATATRVVTISSVSESVAAPVAVLNTPTLLMVGANGQFTVAGSTAPGATSVAYDLDFGDGNMASGQSITHAYNWDGIQTVTLTLTATYADGSQKVAFTSADVEVLRGTDFYPEPTVAISGPTSTRFDRVVGFTSVVNAPGAESVNLFWSAPGNWNSGPTFQTLFPNFSVGLSSVSLDADIWYADGSVRFISTNHLVTVVDNAPPTAVLTGATTGLTSQAVSFDASGSGDSDGTLLSMNIDFGDGNSTGAQVASHVFTLPGVYNVTLSVTDNDGAVATATRVVTISPYNTSVPAPLAVLNGPTQLVEGETGAYTAAGSTAQGGAISYKLYFGNGNTLSGIAGSASYPTAGDYQVAVLVTATYPDATSSMATAVLPVHVITPAQASSQPYARFTAPVTAVPSRMVTLDGSTSTPGSGYITTYNWNFGDGRPAFDGASSVNVTFPTNGVHSITLTVTNSAGLVNSTQRQISVINNKPMMTGANLDTAPYNEASLITVTPVGYYDADGEPAQYYYYWYVNGLGVGANYVPQINGNSFSRGDTVQTLVVPFDGIELGDAVWSDVAVILNTAPSLASTDLNASPHYESSTLTVTPVGWFDLDGDTAGYQYQWYVNSVAVVTGTTASLNGADFNHFDQVYVEVTPDDGFGGGLGIPVDSAVSVISNTEPTLTSTVIDPASYDENSVLTLTLVSGDIDGDPVLYGYQWQVDTGSGFVSIAGAVQPTLAGGNFNETDQVRVVVTPHDPYSIGAPQTSAAVTIGNTTPTMVSVTVAPMSAFEGSTLVATPLASDLDPTDNPLNAANYAYEWYVNAGLVAGQTTNSLSGAFFNKGDAVFARVTYSDGTATSGALDSAAVTIQNTTPIMTGLDGVTTTGSGVTAIASSGAEHTCVLTAAGGVKCWGRNNFGQLGDGTTALRLSPVDVSGLTSGVIAIDAGADYTCAVTAAGGAKCWGRNNTGQLGDGTTTQRLTPVDVSGLTSGVMKVGSGSNHSCALTTGGGVKCWGYNLNGRLGDNTTTQRLTPVDVVGFTSGVAAIGIGHEQSCLLTTGGGAKCWGSNGGGRLGDGTQTERHTPVDVSGLTSGVASVYSGVFQSCAVMNSGVAKCWGDNGAGNLGDGTQIGRLTPVDVTVVAGSIAKIMPDYDHTCALTTAGAVQCWGSGANGRLGNGTTTNSPTVAIQVSGLTSGVTALTVGHDHECVIDTQGNVKCWGWNNSGRVGDGSSTDRYTPVGVTGLSSSTTLVAGRLSAVPVYETGTLTVQAAASDVDATDNPLAPANFTYTWYVNNVVVPAVTGTSITGANFNKYDEVKVSVTYTDGSAAVSAPLYTAATTIQNTAPVLSTAFITSIGDPAYGTAVTYFVDSWTGLTDIDPADSPTVTFQWYVNAIPVAGQTGRTLPGGYADKGDLVVAQVTPSDGDAFGLPVNSNVVNGPNTRPILASVSFGSGPFYDSDTLTANVAGYADTDGDPMSVVEYRWFVNGMFVAVTQSLNAGFAEGDTVAVSARASDGAGFSPWVASIAVTIQNHIPQLVSASILPSPAFEGSALTISFVANDADSGDTLTPHVLWRVNGAPVSTNLSIDGADFNKDDLVSAEVQIDDGTSYSGFVTATATIQNTPPNLDAATITSVGNPAYGTDATFYVNSWTGLSDVDLADSPVLTYQWYVNGSPVVGQTTNTLSGLFFNEGDSVYAQVTPSDGDDFGLAVNTPSATIINTPPTIASSDVGSGPYYVGSTITVSSMGAADADAGDTVTVEYRWFINGVAGSTATSINSGFAKGATVTAGARAFDGASYSNWVYAPVVTIQNSRPVVNSVTLSPSPAYTDDTISFSATSSDLDSDPVTYAKLWFVNGVSTGVSVNTLASTYFVVGDAVTLELTAYDGQNYGATVTSAALTIQNTLPSQPGITFYPSPYAVGNSLYVNVTTASTDADSHTVTYAYVWYRNGVNQGYASSTTLVTPNLLTGTGESWTVVVAPNDGFANGPTTYAQKTLPQDWFAMGTSPLSAREQSSIVWTGSEVIIWGGWNGAGGFNDGARYNPATDTWVSTSTSSLGGRSAHAAVWTGTEMIVWGGWSGSATLADGERYNPANNSWSGLMASSGLTGRYALSAVWTGKEMVIWGGFDGVYPNNGHRYDPATNAWNGTAMATGPSGRQRHATVWTGKEMIIFSGFNGGGPQSDAWRYNPATNVWNALPAAPVLGGYATQAVWTGAEMVVFGGDYSGTPQNTGARYSPANNTWTALPSSGLAGRQQHNMVWTGREVIVWGGTGSAGTLFNDGRRYDPATNQWAPMSFPGIAGRRLASAVWTGNEMVVWGGYGTSSALGNGSRYRPYPTNNDWLTTTLNGAPAGRFGHTAVWTGSEMIIWGGRDMPDANRMNTGSRYNPANDSWLPTAIAPITGRYTHTAVWAEKEMIVWGGYDSGNVRQSNGARYDPRTDSWQVLPAIPGGVDGRQQPYAAWTGREMLVWGGLTPTSVWRNDGARYDPLTNTWGTISSAPLTSRGGMVSVWTGKAMLVWGGYDGSYPNTGARYYAHANTWDTMSTVGVTGREMAAAAWTGSEMLVFGGKPSLGGSSASVFRYHADTNSWTSGANAPLAPRFLSSGVWTGGEFIVWGGLNMASNFFNDGARYDPRTNVWESAQFAMRGRAQHSAVWTGQEMVVWGGQNNVVDFNDGARYSPPLTTDTWFATDTADADLPAARYHNVTVWTGSEVVIWGGNTSGGDTNTGGRYDPATDTWRPTTTTGAPAARNGAKAVWTGREMLMWGGSNVKTGGRYNPASDSWVAIPIAGEPGPDGSGYRNMFAYAWTGREFAIWGGHDGGYPADGALYDPIANSWRDMTATGAPTARHHAKGVWTGREMIVFGGHTSGVLVNFPYLFDPAAGPNGTWTTGSNAGAPVGRNIHAQVWTGKEMLVWGGDNAGVLSDGGRYNPATNTWSGMAASPLSARYHHAYAWTGKEMLIWGGYNGTSLADGAAYDPRSNAWRSIITADAPSARHFDFNNDMATVWTGREWFIWGGMHQETATRLNTGARFIPGEQDVPVLVFPASSYTAQPTTYSWYTDADGGNGTQIIGPGNDDNFGSSPIAVPFDVYLYDRTATDVWACSNAFVRVGSSASGCHYYNSVPNNNPYEIYLDYTDRYVDSDGQVRYAISGTAPNRRLVITYSSISMCCSDGGNSTYQLVIFEGSSNFLVQYQNIDGSLPGGVGATNLGDGSTYSPWTPSTGAAFNIIANP